MATMLGKLVWNIVNNAITLMNCVTHKNEYTCLFESASPMLISIASCFSSFPNEELEHREVWE
jgi:hypothetical protein